MQTNTNTCTAGFRLVTCEEKQNNPPQTPRGTRWRLLITHTDRKETCWQQAGISTGQEEIKVLGGERRFLSNSVVQVASPHLHYSCWCYNSRHPPITNYHQSSCSHRSRSANISQSQTHTSTPTYEQTLEILINLKCMNLDCGIHSLIRAPLSQFLLCCFDVHLHLLSSVTWNCFNIFAFNTFVLSRLDLRAI